MRLRHSLLVLTLLSTPALAASSWADLAQSLLGGPSSSAANLPTSEIADGIRQALAKGTTAAVNQLGRKGGFWGNPRFQIPLPGPVARLQGALDQVGAGAQLDQLHEAINRAAEQAVPVAADVFGEAVKKLTLNDVRGILNGPKNAATLYFKRTTSGTLTQKFEPIVARVTARTGLGQEYQQVLGSAGPLASMLGGGSVDLNGYVTQQALKALFAEVGAQEAAIRTDPAARTTALLQKVFGHGG